MGELTEARQPGAVHQLHLHRGYLKQQKEALDFFVMMQVSLTSVGHGKPMAHLWARAHQILGSITRKLNKEDTKRSQLHCTTRI